VNHIQRQSLIEITELKRLNYITSNATYMKVLVPTDFSQCSTHAINTGVQFIKKFGGQLDILHCLDTHSNLLKDVSPNFFDPILKVVQKELFDISRRLDLQNIQHRVEVKNAALTEGIVAMQEYGIYDLIIMGSRGLSGLSDWYLGTNTQKVIRTIENKILIVKELKPRLEFNEVLFVTGLDNRDKRALAYFLEFIRPFEPKKLHILSVDTSGFFSQPPIVMLEALKDFKKIVRNIICETHFYPDFSIEAGVQHFSDENKLDLIAVSNHIKHPVKRFFRGSNVEAIASQIYTPIMTIDYEGELSKQKQPLR